MSAVSTEPNWEFTLQEARLNGGSVEPLDYQELQDWAYTGKRLVPLKGYSDIVWERPKSRKRPREVDHPELFNRRIRSARAQIVQ
jgi:hypothetical protein